MFNNQLSLKRKRKIEPLPRRASAEAQSTRRKKQYGSIEEWKLKRRKKRRGEGG
jgi:hypothetical protein